MTRDKFVIVIDDERTLTQYPNAIYARTSKEGIALLQDLVASGQELDELWLDHDLGDATGELDDIKPVVAWLEEESYFGRGPVIGQILVHTANSVAGPQMVSTLSRYYAVRRVPLAELNQYV